MDPLDRLYHKLRQVVQREYPDTATPRFSVAELYQRLIPYRAVRGELGILELAEYEHALLRLLAGERGYLSLVALEARDEIRRELNSTNPILGVYRDYAAAEVVLNAEAAEPWTPEPAPPDTPPEPAPTAEVEAVPHLRAPDPEPALPPPTVPPREPAPATCHACHTPLPDVPDVHFCPTCGASQREVPCGECGAWLRMEWNFCIRCGAPRAKRNETT